MTVTTTPEADGQPPRGVDRLIVDRQEDWAQLADLVQRAEARGRPLVADEVLALGEGYRAAAADLARARQRWPGDPVVAELDTLVRRARAIVYRTSGTRGSLVGWLTTGVFVRIRERPRALLAAVVLLWGPSLGFALWADHDPATASRVAQISPLAGQAADAAGDGGVGTASLAAADSAALATQIFTNNIRVSLLALALGLTGGLGTAVLLFYNGATVGLVVGILTANGLGSEAASLLAPHGFLEWSLVTVAGAAGLRVGLALVDPGLRPRGEALVAEMRAATEMALGSALWLIPTGLVEGFITPLALPPATAVAVGLAVAAPFWILVLWRGRPIPDEPT